MVYALIAILMMFAPFVSMEGNGIDWFSLAIAGRAELRAYYFGTALALSYCCWDNNRLKALKVVALSMGCFALARFYSYVIDGVDTDAVRALSQHVFTGLEALACAIASGLILVLGEDGWKQLQSKHHPARSHFTY